MKVSVVACVKNEEEGIAEFLDSLLSQTHRSDQIIIADNGSTDRTAEIISSYIKRGAPIQLMDANGLSVGEARNLAIKMVNAEAIACTTCNRLDSDWLKNLMFVLKDADVAVGICKSGAKTLFEKCIFELFLPKIASTNKFLPAYFESCCAFKKSVWEKVGGYGEIASYYGTDTVFAFNLKEAGLNIKRTREAVMYYRPPKNFRELFWRKLKHSLGDAKLHQLSKFHHHTRRWIVFSSLTFSGLATLLIPKLLPIFLVLTGAIIGTMLLVGVKVANKLHNRRAVLYVPPIIFVNELGHVVGTIYGIFERLRGGTN